MTFLLTWFAAVVNAVWEQGWNLRSPRIPVALFTSFLLAVLLLGGVRLAFFPPTAQTVQVAAVVPDEGRRNDALKEIAWSKLSQASDAERAVLRSRFDPVLDDLFVRTVQVARAGAKIIVWTEAAAPILKEDEPAAIERAQAIARQENIYLQLGLGTALRGGPPFYENRAILIAPAGTVVWAYDKSCPAGGGEAANQRAGTGIVATVQTPYGKLATIICYDADFPMLVRQAGLARVDLLLVPSNDDRAIQFKHPQQSVFRAIENGVNLLRPTSSGISIATDYQGQVLALVNDFTTDRPVMVAYIPTRGVATLYPRMGNLFAYLCIAGLVAAIVLGLKSRPLKVMMPRWGEDKKE